MASDVLSKSSLDILPYELPPLGEFEGDNKEKESLRLLHFKVNWWTVIDWLEFQEYIGTMNILSILFVAMSVETSSLLMSVFTPSDRRFLMASP